VSNTIFISDDIRVV